MVPQGLSSFYSYSLFYQLIETGKSGFKGLHTSQEVDFTRVRFKIAVQQGLQSISTVIHHVQWSSHAF